jgi:AcrR family transcriptional regulator
MMSKRAYTLRKRAEGQDETRRRIVEATMHLHEEIGPRATTISAIADRAGVQRLTVYRHFEDETAVFQACTAHWLTLNPMPNPSGWAVIEPPLDRARAALSAFYRYYEATRRMWTAAYRDVADVPALHGPMGQVAAFMETIGEDIASSFGPPIDPSLTATVHHVLAFSTFASLRERGLEGDAMVETALRWIRSAAEATRRGDGGSTA